MNTDKRIPQHVAIIMDGNGRWAELRGKERIDGHIAGVDSVRSALKTSVKCGVRYLTLYAFSTENWGRPKAEVDALMELFCQSVLNEMDELNREGVEVRIAGDREGMPQSVVEHIALIENRELKEVRLTLILALNYGARQELANAARQISRMVASGDLKAEEVTESLITEHLYTHGVPDPDMVIRTGGDQRLSNFLLWQSAYSELYFTEEFWPDFRAESFEKAIDSYSRRERRFGLTSKQIQSE